MPFRTWLEGFVGERITGAPEYLKAKYQAERKKKKERREETLEKKQCEDIARKYQREVNVGKWRFQ